MAKIGFMGVGDQGKYMAVNLLQKNGELYVGYNPGHAEKNTAELVEMGAKAISPAELGEVCDIVFMCLTNGDIDTKVIFEEGGMTSKATPGTLFVDHCSIEADRAKDHYDRLKSMGFGYLECPVSGGSKGAKEATMTFMAAGNEEDYNKCISYFEMMGKAWNYLGAAGNASIAKLCSQIMLLGNTMTMMEAMTFAAKMGLAPEDVWQAVRSGLAGSNAMDFYLPMILEDPNIQTKNIVNVFKDVRNALKAADEVNCPMPVMANLHSIYRHFINTEGHRNMDTIGLVNYWEEGANVKVRYKHILAEIEKEN